MTQSSNTTSSTSKHIKIWQWNCRSIKRKRQTLTYYSQLHGPDVIALQETEADHFTIRGYNTYITPGRTRSAILIKNHIVAQLHHITHRIEHILVEIIPKKKTQTSLFILNLYSSPRDHLRDLDTLLREVRKLSKRQKLLVVGDFNAPNVAWGYPTTLKKGEDVQTAAQQHHLTLLNEPHIATRTGNSVTRDTTPDLAFTHRIRNSTWQCTDEALGSDHFIIEIQIQHNQKAPTIGKATIIDWDNFRKDTTAHPLEDIDEWTAQILTQARKYTKIITLTEDHPMVDPHLLHIWEARRSLTRRWKKNKTNRKLKLRIARLTQEAKEYAERLSRQNWGQTCAQLQGTFSSKRTWALLRALLDKTNTKATARQHIQRLVHKYPGTDQELLDDIKAKYIGSTHNMGVTGKSEYTGNPNSVLDEPFTRSEIEAAISQLTRNTSPGRDRITNKLLRNLPATNIDELLRYINDCWEKGNIPQSWKHAQITLIPKANKPISIQNLRPISLTSCVGKLFEHMVLNRLTSYLEEQNLLPQTMFGFRPQLSTQDILLQIKHDVIDNLQTRNSKAILAIDVKGAFDNIRHEPILEHISKYHCGKRLFNYVKDFLHNRTATIGIGDLRTSTHYAPPHGTPQGSVISPALFNLAMSSLPGKLAEIHGIHHALYADDITIWTTGGSTGEQQDALQAAIDTVEAYLQHLGLTCAPEKSELLILRKRTRGRPLPEDVDPELTVGGTTVPTVPRLRILGLQIPKDGAGGPELLRLQTSINQVIHLIRRITNRRLGIKEEDSVKIIQALIYSRLTYGTPYLSLKNAEKQKLNILIRKAYKLILGLPTTTSTDKLLKLGIHNTWEELVEAQQASQMNRLQLTPTGRALLTRLGYPVEDASHQPRRLSHSIRENIYVFNIPRNMHPEYDKERRHRRATYLQKQLTTRQNRDVLYTDAAKYPQRNSYAISVVNARGEEVTAASTRARNSTAAEELAIAIAMTTATEPVTIVTDSQQACRNYKKGIIGSTATHVLTSHHQPLQDTHIVWTPGHAAVQGNQAAHAAAREHIHRALPATAFPVPATQGTEAILNTYRDLLDHYRKERQEYPAPHHKLDREQSTIWRRLQTNTYQHGTLLHAIHPGLYQHHCQYCEDEANTLQHMVLDCPNTPRPASWPLPSPLPSWQALLSNPTLDVQLWLTTRAARAAEHHGFLD